MLPTLYGKASNGKIRQWVVYVEDDEVVVLSGQVNGKQKEDRSTSAPKNIGKSNETTAHQQAWLEAESKWKKKLKQDYRESVEDIPQSTLPNLAHKYQEKAHTINWNQTWELPKLDGVRGSSFYKNNGQILQSRGGEEYPVIQEIADELEECFFADYPDSFVDGELYCHGMYLEDITACVKKHNEDTKKIEFHVFDWLHNQDDNHGWYERYNRYSNKLSLYYMGLGGDYNGRIKGVYAAPCPSEQLMLDTHAMYVKQGYEGIILRDQFEKYSFGNRTTGIIKYKVPESEEFVVDSFEISKRGEGTPWCMYVGLDGKPGLFKAPVATTIERRKFYAQNPEKFIGKHLTVDFEKLSKYGKPTKPIGKAFREVDLDGNPKT
jgi:DNA ligase-1